MLVTYFCACEIVKSFFGKKKKINRLEIVLITSIYYTTVDNKGQPWGPALVVFIYVYRIYINIERPISCLKKHSFHSKKILS